MKIKNYECPRCGCNDLYLKAKNGGQINQVGIYCAACHTWIKWADKWEKQRRKTC